MKFNNIFTVKITTILLFIILGYDCKAQFNVSNSAPYNNVKYLVDSVLLGNGITATNITYKGSLAQIGYFTDNTLVGNANGYMPLSFNKGIAISNGSINTLKQPSGYIPPTTLPVNPSIIQALTNTPYDADIIKIANEFNTSGSKYASDAFILEFDFKAQGNNIMLDFSFGSNEFLHSVCGGRYSDALGIFISGAGINGTYTNKAENIALIPNTNPAQNVTAHNINFTTDTSCKWANQNKNFLTINNNRSDFNLSAFSQTFTAYSKVICDSTYHIKIVISDGGDKTFDSGVFLKAKSLNTNAVNFKPTSTSGIDGDSSIVEGCKSGKFKFSRKGDVSKRVAYKCDYTAKAPFGNAASMGIDYNLLPDSIIFLPNVADTFLTVTAFADPSIEGTEYISLTLNFIDACGNKTKATQYMYIIEPKLVRVKVDDISACLGNDISVTAYDTLGYPKIKFLWSNGDTNKTTTYKLTTDSMTIWVKAISNCSAGTYTDSAKIRNSPINPLTITSNLNKSFIYENCGETIEVVFELDKPSTIPLDINLLFPTTNSTAANGIDYKTSNQATFPKKIHFNKGDSILKIPLVIISDTLTEGIEIININADNKNVCSAGGMLPFKINLFDFDSAKVAITNPSPVCYGTPFTLKANVSGSNKLANKFVYSWTNSTSKTDTSIHKLTTAQTIIFTVTDTACKKAYKISESINLTVATPLAVSEIAGKDTLFCVGDTTLFRVNASGKAPIKYAWSEPSQNKNSIILQLTDTKTITVKITDACSSSGISKSKTLVVDKHSPLTAIAMNDTTVNCINTKLTIKGSYLGGGKFVNYYWNNIQSSTPETTINVTDTNGVYVYFMVMDTCREKAIDSTLIKAKTYHTMVLSTIKDTVVCPDATVILKANVSRVNYPNNAFQYNWTSLNSVNKIETPDSLSTVTQLTDIAVDTTYYKLKVTDICNVSDSIIVKIFRKLSCNPIKYNVITPGTDDVNSKFLLDNIEQYPNNVMKIYNRWGKVVYEKSGYNKENAWDAKNVDAGTYYFVLFYEAQTIGPKTPEPTTGFIEVIK